MNSEQLTVRKISEMREVMMEPDASALQAQRVAYYMIRRPGLNITVLPEYRLGKEYPKTYGHFHEPKVAETYKVLLGIAAVLIQKGVDPVGEVKLTRLKKGESFTVPKGYAHSLINLGRGPVVTLDNSDSTETTNIYEPIKEKRGFAYYLIEEGGKLQVVPNPRYAQVPPLNIDG